MQALASLIVLSVVVEVATNAVKQIDWFKRENAVRLVALVFGIGLSCSAKIGILAMLGVKLAYPAADYIITGAIISRGSNAVHDLLDRLDQVHEQ